MQVAVVNGRTVVHMTDAEAVELHARLHEVIHHRKQIIAMEPTMAHWSDVVLAKGNISFSIHEPGKVTRCNRG